MVFQNEAELKNYKLYQGFDDQSNQTLEQFVYEGYFCKFHFDKQTLKSPKSKLVFANNFLSSSTKNQSTAKKTHTLATSVLMVRPVDFSFNPETSMDNQFMNPTQFSKEIGESVQRQFDQSVASLTSLGVNVLVFDKSKYQQLNSIKLYDGVFPNNWFVSIDGQIVLFKMKCESRNMEKMQFPWIMEMLTDQKFEIQSVSNWSQSVIEGTGSIIFDRKYKRAYLSKSKRCEGDLQKLCSKLGYQLIEFQGKSQTQTPFYHTNVLLSIGDDFAVISSYALGKDKERVLAKLSQQRKIIEIDAEQTEKKFCANILQVRGKDSNVLIMSQAAWDGFTKQQQNYFTLKNKIAIFPLKYIEKIGGGSARCMVAEILLNKKH